MAETISREDFCRMILQKRGRRGVRAAAREIGISFATLSRIERGRGPRVDTLKKICRWLQIDPGRYLGEADAVPAAAAAQVQLVVRKGEALAPEATQALGRLIAVAHRQFAAAVAAEGHQ